LNLLLTWNDRGREKDGWVWHDNQTTCESGTGPDYDDLTLLGAEPAGVDRLVAEHVLDRLPPHRVPKALDYWVSLLAHGGELTVAVTDFDTLARAFLRGEVPMDLLNARLAGRDSLHTLAGLCDVLRGRGLRLVSARAEGLAAVAVARRP
jgi:hypothetical protein